MIALLLIIISASAKALMDASADGKMPDAHLNKANSWKNKYKDDLKTPKFFGSTTFLVFLTDFWHGMQFICFNTLLATPFVYKQIVSTPVDLAIFIVVHKVVFQLFYGRF